jgi:glucokinase
VTSNGVVGALDIGGTHVTAGRVDLTAGSVEPRSRIRVSLSAAGARSDPVAAISRAASSIARPDIHRLGVAVPGPFDYPAGVSRIAHKLQGLYGVDLRAELCGALGLRDPTAVGFLNDAEAFLLGEWWAGAARGHARAVGITLGTGLGSAFLADGRIVRTGPGVPPGGALYELPFRGAPVEQTISRRGLLARYGARTEDGIDVEEVAARARADDRPARRALEDLGRALGEFLTPWLRSFEPGCLVVGGSIARSWELLEGGLCSELQAIESIETVTVAERLDDAPLLGAAWYVAWGRRR